MDSKALALVFITLFALAIPVLIIWGQRLFSESSRLGRWSARQQAKDAARTRVGGRSYRLLVGTTRILHGWVVWLAVLVLVGRQFGGGVADQWMTALLVVFAASLAVDVALFVIGRWLDRRIAAGSAR